MQCDIELAAIREPCEAVLHCKPLKGSIEFFKRGMRPFQLRLGSRPEFDLPDQMPADQTHHNDKAKHAGGMPDCVALACSQTSVGSFGAQ